MDIRCAIEGADVAFDGMEGEGCGFGDLGGGEALFEQGADAVAARAGAEGDFARAGGEFLDEGAAGVEISRPCGRL